MRTFAYPHVKPVVAQPPRGNEPGPPRLPVSAHSQRDLVVASLLRCPPEAER